MPNRCGDIENTLTKISCPYDEGQQPQCSPAVPFDPLKVGLTAGPRQAVDRLFYID